MIDPCSLGWHRWRAWHPWNVHFRSHRYRTEYCMNLCGALRFLPRWRRRDWVKALLEELLRDVVLLP